jgi:hypothetical protein
MSAEFTFEDRVKFAANVQPFRKEMQVSLTESSVNHPKHYNQGAIETIDYLESSLAPEELRGAYKFNVIKYVSRERYKGGLEDLKKAKWYLDRLVDNLEKEAATR